MKTISLKQVFDSIDYTPAPLPPVESEVMDMAQAHKIIRHFVEDDVAFFNFINSYKHSRYLSKPLQSGVAMGWFNSYSKTSNPRLEIPLSSGQQLKITPQEASGRVKTEYFIDLLQTALNCRREMTWLKSPSSDEAIKKLNDFLRVVDVLSERVLTLSDGHLDQVKNLILPANPADPRLSDRNHLNNVYNLRFSDRTKRFAGNRPTGVSSL